MVHNLVLVYHVNTRLGFEVFMAINITIKVLWNVSPCRLVNKCHCFGGTKCLIFRLHILEDGNLKGLFVCFCLSFLFTCVLVFFLPFLFCLLFFSLPLSDFLSFIIAYGSALGCWNVRRIDHFIIPVPSVVTKNYCK